VKGTGACQEEFWIWTGTGIPLWGQGSLWTSVKREEGWKALNGRFGEVSRKEERRILWLGKAGEEICRRRVRHQ